MNKERYNQIINEVYAKYSEACEKDNSVGLNLLVKIVDGSTKYRKPDIGMFKVLIRHDKSFSERWGLKIEERELSLDERNELLNKVLNRNHERKDCFSDKEFETETLKDANTFNISTKLITITYNNETIEVYE